MAQRADKDVGPRGWIGSGGVGEALLPILEPGNGGRNVCCGCCQATAMGFRKQSRSLSDSRLGVSVIWVITI